MAFPALVFFEAYVPRERGEHEDVVVHYDGEMVNITPPASAGHIELTIDEVEEILALARQAALAIWGAEEQANPPSPPL